MKKICFLTSNYYPKVGGTETLTKTILESISDKYEVELITFKNENRNLFSFPYKVFEFNPNEFQNLDSFFEIKKYDLLIFFSDLHSPYLNLFKNNWCKNYIVVLNLDENSYQSKNNYLNATKNLKNSSMVVTFTKNGVANRFLEEENIKNVYIPNFSRDTILDIKEKSILNKILINKENKNIGYMASYEHRKNQIYILEAIKNNSKLRNYNFIFMGNVSDREYLKHCIDFKIKNKLSNVYFIEGTSDQKIINQYINEIDCMLLCSLAEGLPLALIEGMSSGKPWICTPVGGVSGVFMKTKSGVILTKINPPYTEISDALERCLNFSPSEIRQEWKENFTSELSINNYTMLIERILE
jgi:glycosyltransferase involved in cell wall biosynthesis